MKDTFATRLDKAMKLKNVTQAELVEKTGITKGAISQYLKGEYEPKKLNTARISEALDVNQAWLEGNSDTIERYYRVQEGGGRFPKETVLLLRSFNKLNDVGKNEAIKRVEELTYIDKYIDTNYKEIMTQLNTMHNHMELNAAHAIEGASEEDRQHDDDIMNDDNF